MGCTVPCDIVVLVIKYLTTCAKFWSDECNYIVYKVYGIVVILLLHVDCV